MRSSQCFKQSTQAISFEFCRVCHEPASTEHQGAADSGVRRGSRPSRQNLGGAKLSLCPSIWQILHVD